MDKSWGTRELREKYTSRINETLHNTNYKLERGESAQSIESKVFEKSANQDDYLKKIAKLLVIFKQDDHQKMTGQGTPQMQEQSPYNYQMVNSMGNSMPGNMGTNSIPGSSMVPNMGSPMPGNMAAMPPNMGNISNIPGNMPNMAGNMPGNMQGNMPVGMGPGGMMNMGPGNMPSGMGPGSMPGMVNNMGMAKMQPQGPPAELTPEEEHATYTAKLNELKKYIIPLQKLREREKQKDNKKEQKKVQDVLDFLTNPNRKVKLEALIKYEQVLEKLLRSSSDPASHGPASVEKSAGSSVGPPQNGKHFCQPLIDSVATHACSVSFNNTVRRTFGPALYTLHGDVTMYPSAKRSRKEETPTIQIVESEINRLSKDFRATIKDSSKGNLEVQIIYTKSTIVPCLTIYVPSKYPDHSPWVKDSKNRIGKQVEGELKKKLVSLSMQYTITQLLLAWKSSVVKVIKSFDKPHAASVTVK